VEEAGGTPALQNATSRRVELAIDIVDGFLREASSVRSIKLDVNSRSSGCITL
jgi:hypothetical protein